jgi:hypothetical protein
MLTSYTLTTPKFTLFMWIGDVIATSLSGNITNGVISASCGGVPMVPGTSSVYFTMITPCVGTISIINTITSGVIYTQAAPSTILLSV